MRLVIILSLLVLFQAAYALKPVETSPLATAPTWCDQSGVWKADGNKVVDTRDGSIQCESMLSDGPYSGTPEDVARSFLSAHSAWLSSPAVLQKLKAVRTAESPIGYHVTFEETIGDVPVYPGNLVVTLDKQNIVRFYFSSVYSVPENLNTKASLSSDQAVSIAMSYLKPTSTPHDKPQTKLVIWAGDNRDFAVCWRVWQYLEAPMGDWEVLVDANTGAIRRVHDQACYVDGTGKVFRPDPLTTAQATYGDAGFTDNNNADSPQLDAQQVVDTLRDLTFSGGLYRLTGPWVTIAEFESPTVTPATATNPDSFRFTRNLTGFEDVNVYYNIDKSQRWIQSLGYNNIQHGSINIDSHGLSGQDNSHYIPSTNRIAYGDGGVDDAEDADVIWHEYGHSIQQSSVPGWGGNEEGAMGEGFGDYWAGSYSHSLSTFRDTWVFNWDGHNEWWSGRTLNMNKHYPADLDGEVHDDGEIWSQPCFETMLDITRPIMDNIVLAHHFLLGTSASMTTAAQAILTADQNLYGGIHQSAIYAHFVPRGLLTAPPVFGLTSPNGGEFWPIDSTVSVIWSTGNLGGNVMIQLSRSGIAGTWTTVAASVTNNGLYSFAATGPSSTTCRVRISVVGDPTHADTSAADFAIAGLQVLLSENFESGAPNWSHTSAGGTWIDQWNISTERSHSSSHSYKCGDTGAGTYGNLNDARLASPVINNLPANAVFSFYHQIEAEISGTYADSAYDGGIVEISANGGAFTRIASTSGYNKVFRVLSGGGNPATGPMPGQPCYSGSITTWTQQVFNLNAYAGQNIQLRFRFGSDAGTGREGWYVDDVLLYAPASAVELVVPNSLTITYSSGDIILNWAVDANPYYRIYSDTDPMGDFSTLEGSTSQTTFTIAGAADDKKFYHIVGWDGH